MDDVQDRLVRNGTDDTPHRNGMAFRASDADREQTAALLRHHFEIGCLDTHEFEARIGRCYAAATVDELRELVADLPRSPALGPTFERRRYGGRSLPWPAPIILGIVAVFLLVGLTGGHALWVVGPLAFFFVQRRLVSRQAGYVMVRK